MRKALTVSARQRTISRTIWYLCLVIRKGEKMYKIVSKFVKNEDGATAIEYGLIAAGISIAIISGVKGLGTKLNTTFSSISTQLK
jgi:pilus assembly protein Flp/PilA